MRKICSIHVLLVFTLFVSLLSPMVAFAEEEDTVEVIEVHTTDDNEHDPEIELETMEVKDELLEEEIIEVVEEKKEEEKIKHKETLLPVQTTPASSEDELIELIEESIQDDAFKATLFEFIEEDYEEESFFLIENGFINENSFQLFWFAHVPNVRVASYELFLDGEFVKSLKSRNYDYHFTGLTPSTTYEVVVKALDKNGNFLLEASLSVTTPAEPSGEVVTFTDKNLENAIKEQLGITRELQESDIENLTELYAIDKGITDLSGIERLTNLEILSFFENNISDITPLKELTNLVDLDLDSNLIENVNALSNLKNLHILWLANNPVSDISQLGMLTNLEALFLHETQISNIAVIENLPHLSHLTLHGSLVDFSEGTNTLILLLELKDAGVYIDVLDDEDFGFEFELGVEGINENAAYISWWYYTEEEMDLSYRVQLNWEEIVVTKDSGIELTDLSPNTTYEVHVEVLDESNEVIDFGYVTFKTPKEPSGELVIIQDEQLLQVIKETLYIQHRPLYESDMKRLDWLDAQYRDIKSLEGLQYAVKLEGLFVAGNAVDDLSPLADLDFLMFLNVSDNNITDIEPLKGLYIYDLDLSLNPITDISILSSLEELTYLYLHDTKITDISVLLQLEYLQLVTLFNTEGLTFEEGTEEYNVMQQLMEKGVWVITSEDDFNFPTNIEFEVLSVTESEIEIAWDYFGEESVVGYSVFLNDEHVGDVEDGYFYFEDLLPETSYTISVIAIDEEGYYVDYSYIDVMTEAIQEEMPEEDVEEELGESENPVKENEPNDKNENEESAPTAPVKKKEAEKKVKTEKKNKTTTGAALPNTATNTFNYMALGLVMILAGGAFLLLRLRRKLV
ncbi:LPXTG cell wall anchor domain-containing protein [Bacillus alkalisoli]|uniref:LPXTG cell wall anchor domain-containing protein n=1 Tax=Bacillus alkalisoli TaxID=2011008 RepID=UPI000C246DB7|nr:LPXTG cell wall anchor domain-containing protein [Bacillus alkalisoli]